MLGGFKNFTLQMVAGANVATVTMLLLTGFADYVNPVEHPVLAQAGLAFPVFLLLNTGFFVFWLLFGLRQVLIPIVGFLLCCVPIRTYFPLNVPHSVPAAAIKVLSYNVLGFNPIEGAQPGCNAIMDYIAKSGADIVCVQEANLWGDHQTYSDSVLSPIYAYCDTMLVPNGDCIGIYSKFPIVGKERINYDSKTNLSGAYRLKIDSDTVIVVNNHFESNGLTHDEKENFKEMVKGEMNGKQMKVESKRLIDKLAETSKRRAPEADAVARYIAHHEGESMILCGDFNDNPISYTRRVIADKLTDCYVATANGPGISYHLSGFYVRIDNIMCTPDWKPYACTVDSKVKSSDHYPIYCWLQKQRKH